MFKAIFRIIWQRERERDAAKCIPFVSLSPRVSAARLLKVQEKKCLRALVAVDCEPRAR